MPEQTQNPLDPQAVNLAKAIRSVETQGQPDPFTAKGSSGEHGAYQFMPDTWNRLSKQFGVNVPLEQSTPQQQNEVAYKQIKQWKDQGYNVGQIASMWNSGKPNAYQDPNYKGPNKYGVQFNTPQYAESVAKAYQAIKNGQSTAGITSPSTVTTTQPTQAGQTSSTTGGIDWGKVLGIGGGILGAGAALALPLLLPEVGIPADAAMAGAAAEGAAGSGIGSTILGLGKSALKMGASAMGYKGLEDTLGGIAGSVLGTNKQQPTEEMAQPQQPTISPDLQQSVNASNTVRDAISQALQGTMKGRQILSNPNYEGALGTASTFGLFHPDENGIVQLNQDKLGSALKNVSNLDDQIIKAEGGQATPQQALQSAMAYVQNDNRYTPQDKQQIAEIMQKEISARGWNNDAPVQLSDMRKAQKNHYQAGASGYKQGRSGNEIMAHKALAHGYGDAITNNLANPELHKRAMKMEADLLRTRDIAKVIANKKAPATKGFWQGAVKMVARAAEIYIGDRIGGVMGAVIGGAIGEKFNEKIAKHFGTNVFDTPGMKAALDILHDTEPKVYSNLVSALKQRGVELKPIELGPEKGKTAEEALAQAQKKPTMQNLDDVVNQVIQEKKGIIKPKRNPKKGLVSPPNRKRV